ncbi:MAG TPA: nuclear transport factor 2 family protein [Dongiaceae bacterium]|nr:nuclear transport factor 2 family protein [Dongiaceae bacterium]
MTPILRRTRAVAALGFLVTVIAAVPAPAETPPAPPATEAPAPAAPESAPPAGDQPAAALVEHGGSAGEALAFFMGSRDYRTIRDLKSIMTAACRAAYDRDPTPFNGKKGFGLSAWDYREPALKPQATAAGIAVKGLWEDQGEAIEVRTETVRLVREAGGPWRVAAIEKTASEPLRYKESTPGVTTLRQILRAWIRRDFAAARGYLSDAYLKRIAGRPEGLEAVFAGDPNVRRAAFRIVEIAPKGSAAATAQVRLVEASPGLPTRLDGVPKTLALVKRGSKWLLDDWR